MVLKYNTQKGSSYISTGFFSLHGRRTSLLSHCANQIRTWEYLNKADRNVCCFSQFKKTVLARSG